MVPVGCGEYVEGDAVEVVQVPLDVLPEVLASVVFVFCEADAVLSFLSDSAPDSDSLELIGVIKVARSSELGWADWLVVVSTGFSALIAPKVIKKPETTAKLLSMNLLRYIGERSILNINTPLLGLIIE